MPQQKISYLAFFLALALVGAGAATAADWMINEDYKQLDARGATDFDILLRGNVGGQITGGGFSNVTNPFNNPSRTVSSDGFGATVVRFVGDNSIPADPNIDRHVGIYGTGPKPTVLAKAWSFATPPKRVRVPKSNFDFVYDPNSQTLTLTVENTSPDTVTFSEVGYLISPVEYPIEELSRDYLPPEAFEPLDSLSGEYAPGDSASVTFEGVSKSSYALSYGTVEFSGESAEKNTYDATGGEWSQVRVAAQIANSDADADSPTKDDI